MHSRSSVTLHFRAESYDFPSGKVDAGTVMSWMDKAGYASAASWTGSNVVASYVGNMHFTVPVPVETPIRVQSRLIYTEEFTVHVQARVVLPEVFDEDGNPTVATDVVLIYSAVDDNDQLIPVPNWEPTTEAAQERKAMARQRSADLREVENALMNVEFPEAEDTSAELVMMRFVAVGPGSFPGARLPAGAILRWLDEAANVCAASWSQRNGVAVFAGGVRLERHVRAGEILEIEARLVHTSTRSMQILQRAWVREQPWMPRESVGHGITVVVNPALDAERAEPVPGWEATTEAERQLEKQCTTLVELRNRIVFSWTAPTRS